MGEVINFMDYKLRKGVQYELTAVGTGNPNVCFGVTENCVNPASCGVICVGCNRCGRWDEEDGDDN